MKRREAGDETPGINYVPVSLNPRSFRRVEESVAEARRLADIVVFSNHWGPNMRERPTQEFRVFAHAALDASADVYFGHSAHIMQGIEVYKGKPLIYDAGDFVDDYAVDPVLRNDQAMLFWLTVDHTGAKRLDLTPAMIGDYQVNRAQGEDFEAIAERIQRLSEEFGTRIERSGDRLTIDLRIEAEPEAA